RYGHVTGVQTCALPIYARNTRASAATFATVLTPEYLAKVAALARVFRAYGIQTFLTARFSAPIEIGGLKTADPLDATVRAWWTEIGRASCRERGVYRAG